MNIATYDDFLCGDPTESPVFKLGLFLDRLVARVRVVFLVELARLCFLGFYDQLESFLESVALAEDKSRSEAEYKVFWEKKRKVAQKVSQMLERLEPLGAVTYKRSSLLSHIVGQHRLQTLRLFVVTTDLEAQGERILSSARADFLKTFGKSQLTRSQKQSLLEKYEELSGAFSRTTQSTL